MANFGGNAWAALISLAFIPLYIRFMGIESYGLVGFYATLQGSITMLDMGLSTTLNRELATRSLQKDKAQETRDLVHTLELGYWAMAVLIGLTVLSLAPFFAHHWVQAGQLSTATVQEAITLMGLVITFQWPLSFYSGGLMGLQRQVLLNGINALMATLRGIGAVLILWLVSPTVQAFFIWQLVISVFHTLAVMVFLWRSLPTTGSPGRIQVQLLRRIWRFAAGMTGTSIMGTILRQMDKIILSKLLTLEMFGYYTLAGTVAATLYRFIGPVSSGLFPRLSQLVVIDDQEGIKQLYHRGCQLMSVLILPAAIVVALFSRELLLLWTQNPTIARQTYLLLSLLVVGTALNGLNSLPYALQLAHGWTKLAFYSNVIAVILLVPLIFMLTTRFGVVGAASVWVILNSGYVLITIQIMHRRLLPDEKWHWYVRDVGLPLIVAILTAGLGRFLTSGPMTQPMMLLSLAVISAVTFCATAFATSSTRAWIFALISKAKVAYGN